MFELDTRLAADTVVLGDFALCRLLLMNDQNYPWFILVPRREDVSEVFQLSLDEQQMLWRETSVLAEKLKDLFSADKINIATLGNVVSQLHMHVIVRQREDLAWPAPVWGKHPANAYEAAQLQQVREKLRMVLGSEFTEVQR